MLKVSKYFLPILITLSAISVSISAAFYSIYGLSKLFAGASLEVKIMATSLEVSKLVIATLLHRYWKELNVALRTYLSIAVVILVMITSLGIYGFLTSAYQETANKDSLIENQIQFLEQKKTIFQDDLDRYNLELERISNTIESLSNAKATQIQVRDTSVAGGVRQTISTTELRLAQSRLTIEEENRQEILNRRDVAIDSLQSIQVRVLEVKNSSDIASELGPLKFIASLTNTSMDSVVNLLILIIVFVFDPLAVSLVLAANFAFDKTKIKISTKEENNNTPPELPNLKKEKNFDLVINDERYKEFLGTSSSVNIESSSSFDQKKKVEFTSSSFKSENDDWVVVDDEPIEEETNHEDEVFDDQYEEKNNLKIRKIIQKTPNYRSVILENGKRIKVHKNNLNENDLTIRYM